MKKLRMNAHYKTQPICNNVQKYINSYNISKATKKYVNNTKNSKSIQKNRVDMKNSQPE